MSDRLRVTQIKSTISHIARNRATVRALGLKRIGHTVEVVDNDATRGMVRQVRFLVSVEEPVRIAALPMPAQLTRMRGGPSARACAASSAAVTSSGLVTSPAANAARAPSSFATVVPFELGRSEERRVGKECTEQCRSRWSPYH